MPRDRAKKEARRYGEMFLAALALPGLSIACVLVSCMCRRMATMLPEREGGEPEPDGKAMEDMECEKPQQNAGAA